jgi:Na+/H+ antiporter NhaD/arsenite permease-like protein
LNIHPPIAYLFVTLLLAFMAASIKKSKMIDLFGEKILKNRNEQTATMMLIALSHVLAPFFLSFVLISCFENWILRFKEKEKTLTLLVASAITGSIITPFGNLRNIFISIALGKGTPSLSFSAFVSTMLPLWIASLFILLMAAYFLSEKNVLKETKSSVELKKTELIFSIILLFFVFGYFNVGKHFNINLVGLIILGGVFCIAFMGTEPLKAVNWWVFIPVGFSFIIYYLFLLFPVGELTLNQWIMYSAGAIGSAGFSSNLFSFILPLLSHNKSVILYSVAVGSIAGILGSFETIWIWAKGRTKIKLSLMFTLFLIILPISLIILFLRR